MRTLLSANSIPFRALSTSRNWIFPHNKEKTVWKQPLIKYNVSQCTKNSLNSLYVHNPENRKDVKLEKTWVKTLIISSSLRYAYLFLVFFSQLASQQSHGGYWRLFRLRQKSSSGSPDVNELFYIMFDLFLFRVNMFPSHIGFWKSIIK